MEKIKTYFQKLKKFVKKDLISNFIILTEKSEIKK